MTTALGASGTARERTGDEPAGDPFRERLLEGLADSIAQRGYRETTVADIVRNAKTSKRTFYAHFTGKDAALLELLEAQRTVNEVYLAYYDALADHARALVAVELSAGVWDVEI